VTSTCDLDSSRRWESVSNVGNRPTFNGADQTVETYLLSELQGEKPQSIELAFHWRLRDEKRFESPELLRQQILLDAAKAQRFYRGDFDGSNCECALPFQPIGI
jgi:riboflavin kinase/FMN adenylyltransferase